MNKKLWLAFVLWEVFALLASAGLAAAEVFGGIAAGPWELILILAIAALLWWGFFLVVAGFIDYAKRR